MNQTHPKLFSHSSLILRGDTVAQEIQASVRSDVVTFIEQYGRAPHLTVLLAFDHPASNIYVKRKAESCEQVGIRSTIIRTPCTTTKEVIDIIERLNRDDSVDAILVQFPLHPNIDSFEVTKAIDPAKDVDGFSPFNLGKLVQGDTQGLIPCTPKGIVKLLEYYSIPIKSQHVVIIGRSMVVGRPLGLLLSSSSSFGNATVTMAHRQTRNLGEITKSADILIAAAGSPGLITGTMVKEGATVIDVGINRVVIPSTEEQEAPKTKLVGDIAFDEVLPKVRAITPVPKGVGPMTVACLLENTILCAKRRMR